VGRSLIDTCVVSNFSLIGRYELLETLYGKALVVTRLVETELRNGLPKLPNLRPPLEAIEAGRLEVVDDVTEDELRTAGSLPRKFSGADRVGLAVAFHRQWTLLTDERALLRECAARGIETLRTDEILIDALDRGALEKAQLPGILDAMEREAHFRPDI